MKLRTQIYQTLIFTVIGFSPVVLISGVLLVGLLLNLAIMLLDSSTLKFSDVLSSISFAIIIIALLVIVPTLTFSLFNKINNWLLGSIILYAAWLFLTIILSYLFWGTMAGASMAVVDGITNTATIRSAMIEQTLSFVLYCHVAIIPWVLGAGWILKRNSLARFISSS